MVNVSTSQSIRGPQGLPLPSVPKDSPYNEYFGEFFENRGQSVPDRMVSSLGSGFIIDGKEGIIVTNNHVIDGAEEIQVNLHDGTKLKAELIGKDTKTDIALLKVNSPKELKAVKFGSSNDIKVGDWVMAIGNPFGLGGTSPSASSRPRPATSIRAPTTTTCRRTPRSTRATPAARCSTWTARWSA